MIHPIQVRAARVLLGMDQQTLASTSGVGLATLKRFEASGSNLTGTLQTISKIRRTLETAGILFIEQDEHLGPGVRLKRPLT